MSQVNRVPPLSITWQALITQERETGTQSQGKTFQHCILRLISNASGKLTFDAYNIDKSIDEYYKTPTDSAASSETSNNFVASIGQVSCLQLRPFQSSNLLQDRVIYGSPPHMSNDLPIYGSAERKVVNSPFCPRGSLTNGYDSKEVYHSLGVPEHKPYPEPQSSQRLSHQERRSYGHGDDARHSDTQSVPPNVGPNILFPALLSS